MSKLEILMIAVGLAMDAFAVSICKGLAIGRLSIKNYIAVGIWFGGFQAFMPLIGYMLGSTFSAYIQSVDNYIAFALLLLIGCNMIREAVSEKQEESIASMGFFVMLMLALATSVDALAIGVTFAFYKIHIITAVLVIGITAFIISMIGLRLGNIFGTRHRQKAEIFGGSILIILALKLLIEGVAG